jgi:hypothetical protein
VQPTVSAVLFGLFIVPASSVTIPLSILIAAMSVGEEVQETDGWFIL